MAVVGPTPRKLRKIGDSNNTEAEGGNFYDEETQKALEEMDRFENELDAVNEQASEEILKVEQKYNKVRKPIFDKRNEIIPKIPLFWVTAFVNHPDLGQIIDECEEDCLHHWTKLEVVEFEDIKSGYQIIFHFDENPYFENTVLTKEFHIGPTGQATSQSTEIKWKEGFDLRENLSSSSKITKKRLADQKSFFLWFMDHTDPAADDVAEIIKDDLWQNPLQYFLVPDMTVENGIEEDEVSDAEEDEEADNGTTDPEEGANEAQKNESKEENV